MTPTTLVTFDEHASFECTDGGALTALPGSLLEHIAGGGLDGFCRSNRVCYNTTNTECINTTCEADLRDVVCFSNAGCVG